MNDLKMNPAALNATLEHIGLHDHLCLIYETQAEQFAAAVPFVRLGLERGEQCVYIADDNTAAAVCQAMEAAGIDVVDTLARGALVVASKQETYLKQGYFDPDEMIHFLEEATAAAKAAGFSALRVAGEMTWALGGDPGVERLIEYEAKLNHFFPKHDCLGICQYNRTRFAPEVIINVLRTHPQVIFGGLVCQNFYYVPPTEFLAPDQAPLEVERLLRNILERERYELALYQSRDQLAALNTQLQQEIQERQRAEAALQQAYDQLELRVEQQTVEHSKTSRLLQEQMDERRRAREELYRERDLLSRIMETSPVGITLLDRAGRLTFANSRAEQVLGLTREELTQRTYNAPPWCITDYEGRPFPDEMLPFRQVMVTGRPVYDIRHTIEWPDGRCIYLSINAAPLRNERNEIDGVVSIVEDVTEQVLAQKALQDSQRFVTRINNAMPSGLYIYDLDERRNVYVNRRATELLQYSSEELERMESDLGATLFHPADMPKIIAHHSRLRQAGDEDILEIEYRIRTGEGKWRWFRSRDVVFNRDDNGRPHQVLGAAVDITEYRRTEQELRQVAWELARSNADLEQFAYVASHDLQEPLRMISSYLQLLAQRYQDKLDANAREYIDYAVNGAGRMQRMINDLLAYARVDTHGKPFEPISAESILNQVIANLQIAVQESGGVITHDPLPTLLADPVQLLQVFQNLLSNALKFRTNRRPEIHVSAVQKDKEWLFAVSDNGPGLNPQDGDRIFRIFQRLHTWDEYPGSGIGLALCKKIVERHGGRIWVESRPGEGSTFYFTVPLEENRSLADPAGHFQP